jgi:hypothetical protein
LCHASQVSKTPCSSVTTEKLKEILTAAEHRFSKCVFCYSTCFISLGVYLFADTNLVLQIHSRKQVVLMFSVSECVSWSCLVIVLTAFYVIYKLTVNFFFLENW